MKEKHIQWMWIGIVLVHRRQLAKRRDIRLAQSGPLQGVAVALPLAAAADRVASGSKSVKKTARMNISPGSVLTGSFA